MVLVFLTDEAGAPTMLGPMWNVTAGDGNMPLQLARLGLAVKADRTLLTAT